MYDIKQKTMRCEHPVSAFWLHADTPNIYWDFKEGDEVLADPEWLQQMGKHWLHSDLVLLAKTELSESKEASTYSQQSLLKAS